MIYKVECPKCLGFVLNGKFFGKCDRCDNGEVSMRRIKGIIKKIPQKSNPDE